MAITLEAIRAAGGIVHSDGNIFFRDISMLQGLAGAAPAAVAPFGYVNTYTGQFLFDVEPCRKDNEGHWRTVYLQPAAVAPQGGYPPLPEPVADWVQRGSVSIGGGSLGHEISREVVFTAAQMRAYFDLGRQPAAAPALEAPAAPAVPAGFALVPIEPTQQMLDAGRWSGAGSVSIHEEWARKEVWSRMLATVTPPPAAYADDLVALVTELVQALRKATPDNDLAGHALDYLKRNGLQESPLRAADTAPQAPAAPWKDHLTARLVNDLRDCAIKYHGAGQLRERIAHIVVPLCDQLKGALAAPAATAVDASDTARLNFVLAKDAFIAWTDRDDTIRQCQLLTQDEDENYHVISGEHRFFNTPREAIDAAIAAQSKEGGAA